MTRRLMLQITNALDSHILILSATKAFGAFGKLMTPFSFGSEFVVLSSANRGIGRNGLFKRSMQ